MTERERFDVAVIGGGQAGLATGYHLAKRELEFVILDAGERIGDSWRRRWDSLRLFTPARHDGLPGMAFPADPNSFPTKDEMADYLEAYAARLDLPVSLGTAVDWLKREGDRYVLTTRAAQRLEADHVVVATGAYWSPRIPGFARELDPSILQLHVDAYRNPDDLQDGPVLVVGAGNSGAEIALESAVTGHPTSLSGRHPGRIPSAVHLGGDRVFWWFASHLLSLSTPIGRRARRKASSHGGPLIRIRPRDIAAAGIERVPRVAGVRDGQPQLEDGRVLDAANVVWCTGFANDFSWIRSPAFDEKGMPIQLRGVVPSDPGLYFVGLPFLHNLTSALVGGVGRDAEYVVRHIAARIEERRRVSPALSA
jgi:putative flavoprotein involved in K+ transport